MRALLGHARRPRLRVVSIRNRIGTHGAPSEAAAPRHSVSDQARYIAMFNESIDEMCGPDSFVLRCFFHDEAECERALQAQVPACMPDAAMPDSSAGRWALGEQMGECTSRGALGKLQPRLDDPTCKKRFPTKRIENPYLDASGKTAP